MGVDNMRWSFMIYSIVILVLACAGQPSLLDYQVKSTDEQQVVNIISEFENAANSYDAQRLYTLYAPEATIQTSTKHGSLNWEVLIREEWLPIVQRRYQESYVNSGLIFKFFEPKSIVIEGDKARISIPYKLSSLTINYSETGLFKFKLSKNSFGWIITKFRYEILISNHRQWNEYQQWLKQRK